MQLDLIVENARLITGDPARPSASRLGVWRGVVVGVASSCSSSMSSIESCATCLPALFTSTSSPPSFSTAWATRSAQNVLSRRSPGIPAAVRPSACRTSRTCWASFSSSGR